MLDDNQSSETKYGGASTARELAAFSVLAGILATFTLGYFYGLNNHLETLLPVVRILDPQFCRGDVVVAGLTAYGPRFYYSWICALAAKSLTLPGAMLALTLVQNVGIALVTGFAARDMYGCRSPAPFIAVILLLSVESIQLGWAGMLRQPYAQASNLGLVAAMFSLWQGIRLRPYVATAAAMLAGFVHPLVGLETGGVALAIGGMSALADASRPVADRRWLALRAVVGLAALALFAAIVWGPAQKDGALTTGEFLAIYGFRASHHVLPSLFRVRDYGFAGAFLAAAHDGLPWRNREGRFSGGARNGFAISADGGFAFVRTGPPLRCFPCGAVSRDRNRVSRAVRRRILSTGEDLRSAGQPGCGRQGALTLPNGKQPGLGGAIDRGAENQ